MSATATVPIVGAQGIPKRGKPGTKPRPDLAVVRSQSGKSGVTYHHARLVWIGERKSPALLAEINAAMRAAGLPEKQA